jgi:hypothetical protein
LGVDAPPGFRIRWGFFFVADELTTRFFLEEASSDVGGFSTKESIRPLRRREFVGKGGAGVASLDSAETHRSLVGHGKQACVVTDLSGCYLMVLALAFAEGYSFGYLVPSPEA